MSAYAIFLFLHNLNRWVVLLSGLLAIIKGFTGKVWEKSDNTVKLVFVSAMDLQLVLGIVLYFFLSPITKEAFSNVGAAMKNSEQRFYLVEHFIVMVAALAVAHVGSAKIKRTDDDSQKFKFMKIFFSIALILIIARTPWARPLLRF